MFLEEDVNKATEKGLDVFGPEYFDSMRVASNFIDKFQNEQFKPLVESISVQIQDKIWEQIVDYLLMDTESNLHSEMSRMVENTVKALLSGEEWALQRYTLGSKYDHDKIRKKIASYIPKDLQDKRIEDLEDEIKHLKDRISFLRD